MSIIVEKMKLPKSDGTIKYTGEFKVYPDGKSFIRVNNYDYPAYDIPDKYGDLIDRDKLLTSLRIMEKHKCSTCSNSIDKYYCKNCWIKYMESFVSELPVVIKGGRQ